jgi:hypothetical protein
MDKLVTQITDAEDKLSTIEEIYQEWNGMTRV